MHWTTKHNVEGGFRFCYRSLNVQMLRSRVLEGEGKDVRESDFVRGR